MKIRNGFVSNSSSSSFCIYGVYVDSMSKELRENCSKQNLYVTSGDPNYDEGYYIGREYSSIKDDETGKQFKDDVKERLQTVGISIENIGLCEQAWYDG